jgi:hypothetical protein
MPSSSLRIGRGASLRLGIRLALVLAALAVSACAQPPAADRVPPPGREQASLLPHSERTKDELHCEAGDCARWYRIGIAEAAELRIEVYGPAGPGLPDFDVRLEDASGEMLWGYAPTGHSPRKIERMVGPGAYYLLLESVGDNGGVLAYEVFPSLASVGPIFLPGGAGEPVSRPDPARGPEVWVAAEILQVEGQAGRPVAVLLDAGARDDLRPGQQGELLDGGDVIATFELVDVENARSRGRLHRTPSDTISYDVKARIRVPLE